MKPTNQSETPTGNQKLLTRCDVAKRWACCEHTVARCAALQPIRFNKRRLRYRIEDVQAVESAAHHQGITL